MLVDLVLSNDFGQRYLSQWMLLDKQFVSRFGDQITIFIVLGDSASSW